MSADASGKGTPVDYRFTLANERTFLAWLRTALALLAGAVAVLHLLPLDWSGAQRTTVGLTLTVLAGVITVYAPLRWYHVQRVMSRGQTLRMSLLPVVATFAVFVVCAVILWGNLR
ncbi:DUF202 domain-containing protein [Nocardiopsis sp. NPDC050513]|uniref:DUF202 domain-containing protein n=1 Tax=Nocardiopsis sp. NPDC050513 TaxID=3364338 RepID=UPI0037929383